MRFSTASKTFSSFSWKEMTQFWAATMEICWPRGVSSSTPMRTARAMARSLSPCSSNFGREVAVRMSSWASIGMSKKAPTMWTIWGSVMPRTWIQTMPGLPSVAADGIQVGELVYLAAVLVVGDDPELGRDGGLEGGGGRQLARGAADLGVLVGGFAGQGGGIRLEAEPTARRSFMRRSRKERARATSC